MLIVLLEGAIVVKKSQPFACGNLEMKAALRANVQVGFQILLPDRLFALLTLGPKPLGADRAVANGDNRRLALLKPCHQ